MSTNQELNEAAVDAISSFIDYKQQTGGYEGFSWLEAQVIFKAAYKMGLQGEAGIPDWEILMERAIKEANQ